MKTDEFNFDLPERFIAQSPVSPRDSSRLLSFDVGENKVVDGVFTDIESCLKLGDVLVVNKSKVIPARVVFELNGGRKEIFVLDRLKNNRVKAMVRPGEFFRMGRVFKVSDNCEGRVIDVYDDGTRLMDFNSDVVAHGEIPLPPYIENTSVDRSLYQTVYADDEGSVAAPTAGLHFTEELMERIRAKGVKIIEVVLHVGRGTFLPVFAKDIDDHVMHEEFYEISQESCDVLNEVKNSGGRIVAVGTTSVRVLESSYCCDGAGFSPKTGTTDIFIFPGGYRWKAVDALITNFHLPNSTLLMLVSSFLEDKGCYGVSGSIDKLRDLYDHAKASSYRFYSFGDAMFLF